jgi:hypothetical protein
MDLSTFLDQPPTAARRRDPIGLAAAGNGMSSLRDSSRSWYRIGAAPG